MGKGRLEAFSDGVIAIIITIMVLELKVPHGASEANIDALRSLKGVFGSYVLSFVFVAIYWNNHHHMLHASERVTGGILWANVHLLFWLSLVPFVTAWMGENDFPPLPVACYGAVMFMCGVAFNLLARMLVRVHGPHSTLALRSGATARAGRRSSFTVRQSPSPSSIAGCRSVSTSWSRACGSSPTGGSSASLTTNPEPEPESRPPEPRIPTTRAPNPETRVPNPESRIPSPESRLTSL